MTTPLDDAFAAMEAEGTDAARLRWFDRLVASELFLLLEAEAEGDTVRPRVFEVEDGAFVCVFDREERLSAFAGDAAPYASLSGRALSGMLAGQGLGLAVNLGTGRKCCSTPMRSTGWRRCSPPAPTRWRKRRKRSRHPAPCPRLC
jgi:hypothetical protein